MTALVVILVLLLVLAVVAIAVGVWLVADSGDHTGEIARIAAEEQLALWRLQAIRRQAQAEMRRMRDEARPRSPWDR